MERRRSVPNDDLTRVRGPAHGNLDHAGDEWTAAGIAARVDGLIAERDAGDVRHAAFRCGVPREALACLAITLADDAHGAGARAATVLAAVARGYGVDATWLVTGVEDFRGERLAAAARLRVAELLQDIGERLLAARQSAVPGLFATVYDSPHDDHPPR